MDVDGDRKQELTAQRASMKYGLLATVAAMVTMTLHLARFSGWLGGFDGDRGAAAIENLT